MPKALELLVQAQVHTPIQDLTNRLSILYLSSQIYQDSNNFGKALQTAHQGLTLAQESQHALYPDFLKLLSDLYKENNPAIALGFLNQYQIHREEFLAQKYSEDLKTIQHNIEKNNIEFELAQSKVNLYSLANWLLLTLLLLLASLSLFFFYSLKKKRKEQYLLQSISHHKQQLLLLEFQTSTQAEPSDNNSDKQQLQQLLVETMIDALDIWESHKKLNRIDLAEQSKIWTVTIDSGSLRTRSLDKYLSISKIPKNPRWRNVIKTCHFILTDASLPEPSRNKLEGHIALIMEHIKEHSHNA